MNIKEKRPECLVLDCDQQLDAQTSIGAERMLQGLVGEGHRKILLNLEHCQYMSSMGLRVLLSTARTLRKNDGELVLCTPTKYVLEVLQLAGFTGIIKVCESEEAGLQQFKA